MNDNNENNGVGIQRGAIQLNIGGIYKSKLNDKEYQLIEFIDLQQAVFKDIATTRTEVLSIHDFNNINAPNNISLQIDINSITDADWENAQKKFIIIEPILNDISGYQGTAGQEKRAKECNVSSKSIRRWLKSYRQTHSIASLVDNKRGWQEGNIRLEPIQHQIIEEVIKDFYLTIQRPTVTVTIEEVFKRCHKLNIKKPSKKAIRYRIERISEKDYLRGRGYRERAKNKFIAKTGSFPTVNEPLAVIQIDHTPADIILVDDKHRKPIGRPYITVAIDIYSRMITGYYISLDAPSVTSVGMCLSRSILPKDELLRKYDIDANWDVFGIPKKLHVDNGSDFRADSLRKSCALYGIDIEFRPLARPEFGGHIERLIGNIMQKVHELPGTTFSNIRQKDNYDSEKHASLTLDEFEKWFLTYITKVYHQKIHSGIDRAPAKQWELGIFGGGYEKGIGIPSIPVDAQALILDFMPIEERTIQRQGVTIDGIHYYDPCLNQYINASESTNKKKKQFTFRVDPRDISQIWFYDPQIKKYFRIPYANQALPQMSKWEYQVLRKQVLEQHKVVNDTLIYQAWDEMQQVVDQASQATKSARRAVQRKKTHVKSQSYHTKSDLVDNQDDILLSSTTSKDLISNLNNENDEITTHTKISKKESEKVVVDELQDKNTNNELNFYEDIE